MGNKEMFVALECVLTALQQSEAVIKQAMSSTKAEIWADEDAAEFQSAALELLNALARKFFITIIC